jgi:hypothetical protein
LYNETVEFKEFFSQGVSHLTQNTQDRIAKLKVGEKLFFCADLENLQDEDAHMLRTQDPVEFVGYCPKYFAKDFEKLFNLSKESFNIKVKQILEFDGFIFLLMSFASKPVGLLMAIASFASIAR